MSKLINVSYRDLADGKPGNPEACPIALAVRREFPELASKVRVTGAKIEIGRYSQDLTAEQRKFVNDFDSLRKVAPIDGFYISETALQKANKKVRFARLDAAKRLQEAADTIMDTFSWSSTEEESGYWAEVRTKLQSLASQARDADAAADYDEIPF